MMPLTLGIAAVEQEDFYPFGKQTFFFEDMVRSSLDLAIDLFFFSPLAWKIECKQIDGFVYRDNAWIKISAPFPGIIYDRAFTKSSEGKRKLQEFRNYMKKGKVPFLNPVDLAELLNNKVEFHKFLIDNGLPTLNAYPARISISTRFQNAMERGKEFFLKPTYGTGGFGIFNITKQQGNYLLINHTSTKTITFRSINELFSYISGILDLEEYFIQEKADLSFISNSPFDIRVIVQNSGIKDYRISGSGVRVGLEKSLVSNLNSGGTAMPVEYLADYYLQHFSRDISLEINRIYDICLECSVLLHNEFGNFLEIGYDILLTNDLGPIIIEGNPKPSRWIFNMIADNYKDNLGMEKKYRGLRVETVRAPVLFTAKNYRNF